LGPRRGTLHRIRVLQDQESLSSRRLEAYLHAVAGLRQPDQTPWPFNGALVGRTKVVRPELLDLLGVRTLVVRGTAPPPERRPAMERMATVDDRTIYQNPAVLPRAYTVSRVHFVRDEAEALAAIVDPDFDGHQEAVAIGEPVEPLARGPRARFRAARIARDGLERVAIEVDVERASLLVLADAFAPGWRVTVDGEPRRLWQVNHYVRGVAVGPGDRHAEFSYRPPGLLPGLALCGAAWGAVLVVAALDRRRGAPRA
jgi:hypothetical protein